MLFARRSRAESEPTAGAGEGRPKRSLGALIAHTFMTVIVGQGAQIVAGIVTARAFGPAGKGIISYAGVFAVFGIAGVDGLRNAMAFQFGNERRSLGGVWRTALTILAAVAPAGSLVFLGLWLHDRSQLAFLFVALIFPFAAFLQTANMVYLVRHAVERINVQNAWTIGAGSSLVIVVAVLAFHANIVPVLTIWAAGYIAAALLAAGGLPRLLRPHDGDAPPSRASLWPEQARFAIKGGLSAIVTLLALRIDIIIVGAMLAKSSLGVYTTALAVAELSGSLSRSVTYATTGRIATEPRAQAVALTSKIIRVLLLTQALAAIVVFIVGPYAIDLLYGARFAGAGLLLRIILARPVVYSVDGVISYFITVRAGRPGMQFAFELGTLALCATSTLLVVRPFGLIGAAAAATATFLVAFAVKLSYYVHVAGTGPREALQPRLDDLPPPLRPYVSRLLPATR
ncbi:MAG: oligosaccharide flippase family protein [Candidatus Eremiobacteraeota bacterium]|nr:oligosaccharide flippase family protein [Candidatus Eremiobacteraeota bacterium]